MHHHIDRHPHRYKYITSSVEPNSAKSISNLKNFRAECWNGISVELGFPLCFDLFLCGTHYTMHQSNKHFWAFFSLSLSLSVSKIRFVINYLFKIGIQTIRCRIFSIPKKNDDDCTLLWTLLTMFGWHRRAMNISYASNGQTLFWHIFFTHVLCHQIDLPISMGASIERVNLIILQSSFDLKYVLINS